MNLTRVCCVRWHSAGGQSVSSAPLQGLELCHDPSLHDQSVRQTTAHLVCISWHFLGLCWFFLGHTSCCIRGRQKETSS